MKAPHLLAMSAASAAMLFCSASAEAQRRPTDGGFFRTPPPSHHGTHGKHRFFVPFVLVERVPVVIEREVVREVPVVVEPPPPPPPPREPYVIGASYASLPGGCMKLIEDGGRATYYLCSGEWYRQVGSGSAAKYEAVPRP